MLVKALRNGLGLIIVGLDKITRPAPTARSDEDQARAQAAVNGLSLYQFYACPFCTKVRRAIHKLNVDIELRNISKYPEYRQALQEQGGQVKVPCLRIEEEGGNARWLYESDAIIQHLQQAVSRA